MLSITVDIDIRMILRISSLVFTSMLLMGMCTYILVMSVRTEFLLFSNSPSGIAFFLCERIWQWHSLFAAFSPIDLAGSKAKRL